MKRNEETFKNFVLYLVETGLDFEFNRIVQRHHVLLREIYFDVTGQAARAACLECMWFLKTYAHRSVSEIARLFDRSAPTVSSRLSELEDVAKSLTVMVALDTVTIVAKEMTLRAKKRQAGNGQRGAQVLKGLHKAQRRPVAVKAG